MAAKSKIEAGDKIELKGTEFLVDRILAETGSVDDITNRMPNMPKQVAYGAKAVRITSEQFESESVFLWALGIDQIPETPMNWSTETRQLLADELGFDVDNPMVLAEMSHIMSKEQITDLETDITFAPEEIDLGMLLNNSDESDNSTNDQSERLIKPTILILMGLSIIIIIIGFLFLRRKK